MARNWEDLFRSWSQPSGDTEEAKCENATKMVRDAVRNGTSLANYTIETFSQGSYRNNTNVRQESDVDICVCRTDLVHFDFSNAPDLSMSTFGYSPSQYTFSQLRSDLHTALVAKFGEAGVTPGTTAFDVHANTYRVDADVVPAFRLRRYYKDRTYVDGTYILTTSGKDIQNFPQQQYDNGVEKNVATGRRYKQIVRALKRLKYEMSENGIGAADPMSSFRIECIVYNCPNSNFAGDSYRRNVRDVIGSAFEATSSPSTCEKWLEVSRLKWLFWPTQKWTSGQVNDFLRAAWVYAECA